MTTIIGVRFKSNGKIYYFDPQGLEIASGTGVIVETARGVEYGDCVQGNTDVPDQQVVQPLKRVVRVATEADMKTLERNKKRADEAFIICKQKIEAKKTGKIDESELIALGERSDALKSKLEALAEAC